MIKRIPSFPTFKKLELSDKTAIRRITNNFDSYSDFNFQSLWGYNVHETVKISQLNSNLVVIFEDYLTAEPTLSFIGTHNIPETIDALLDYAQEQNIKPALSLIPEEIIKDPIVKKRFHVSADPDNHDYILALDAFRLLTGKKYSSKRRNFKKFLASHPKHIVRRLQIGNISTQKKIFEVFDAWAKDIGASADEISHERRALSRFLKNHAELRAKGIGIWHQKELLGFYLYTLEQRKTVQNHYMKTRREPRGLYERLDQAGAELLHSKGYEWLNIQQDLGIPHLRLSKTLCRPAKMLKKHTITR